MTYYISGKAVSSVDYTDFPFGGDAGKGNALSATNGWISFTMARPNVRTAPDGKPYFIVKNVSFRVCAAPDAGGKTGSGKKMYGRASYSDGSSYHDSYLPPNTISWQKAPTVTYTFQGTKLAVMPGVGGNSIKLWLVSGGEFLFERNTGGSGRIDASNGHTWGGSPVGYVTVAQIPSAPKSLNVVRSNSNPQSITATWSKEDHPGGSTEGYVLQYAEDVNFSLGVKTHYPAIKSGAALSFTSSGFSQNKSYWFRIAVRNEVTHEFKLLGGQWSNVVSIGTSSSTVSTPPPDEGLPSSGGGSNDGGTGDTTGGTGDTTGGQPGDPGNTSASGGTSGTSGSTGVSGGSSSGTANADLTAVNSQLDGLQTQLSQLETDVSKVQSGPTETAIGLAIADAKAVAKTVAYCVNHSAGTAWNGLWLAAQPPESALETALAALSSQVKADAALAKNYQIEIQAVKAAVKSLAAAAKTAESSKGELSSAAWSAVNAQLTALYTAVVKAREIAKKAGLTYDVDSWARAATDSSNAIKSVNKILLQLSKYKSLTSTQQAGLKAQMASLFTDATIAVSSAGDDAGSAASYFTAIAVSYDATTPTGDSMTALSNAIYAAIEGTPAPSTDTGTGTGTGDTGTGTGDTGTGTGTGTGTTAPTIIFTPIPDTSATRTPMGNRLISRKPKSTETTVFVYDRGGRRRLGQLAGWTQLSWSRVKDDRSGATITMTPEVARKNQAVLDRMGVARSELVVFRGDQRVWEGPIVRAEFGRNGVTLTADDVLWYAARTVMHGGYSNAYPDVGNVVERIAGIITGEMVRLETPVVDPDTGAVLVPPINVLPYLHTYVEDGDAQTSVVTDPYSGYVWTHLDDLASRSGIDYTVVGRAIHIWDTSRAALGRTRAVTEEDFIGAPYITEYGTELATVYSVTDGQGDFATVYDPKEQANPYYGAIEQLATAYGVTSTTTTTDPNTGEVVKTTTADTLSSSDMIDQATSGAHGRSPVPWLLNVPANSSLDVSRSGLGLDVLVPGVFVPVVATLSGRTFSQMQKLTRVDVTVTASKSGRQETISVTMEPATTIDPNTDGTS